MKAQPKSEEELLQEMQEALIAYPTLPLSQLRQIVPGRSARIAAAYYTLVSPEEHKKRKTFLKQQMQKEHLENVLPKGLLTYIENISLSLEEIAKTLKVRPATLRQYIQEQIGETEFQRISGLKRSYQKTKVTPKCRIVTPKSCIEKYVDHHGYILVPTPCWMKRENKYSYEHQVVILKQLGLEELPAGWVVHHINGDKTDNRTDNLALMTVAGHTIHHAGCIHPLSKLTMWEYEEFMIWKSQKITAI